MSDAATQIRPHILSDMGNMAENAIIIYPVNGARLMLNTCQYGAFHQLHKRVQTGATAQSAHFHLTFYNTIMNTLGGFI